MSNEPINKFHENTWGMEIGAYRQWQQALNDVPDAALNHSKRCCAVALKEELTDIQRMYLLEYLVDGLTMEKISTKHNINKSSVSRTIARAKRRLYRALRYSNPRFLYLPMSTKALSQIALGIRPSAKKARQLANDSYLRED